MVRPRGGKSQSSGSPKTARVSLLSGAWKGREENYKKKNVQELGKNEAEPSLGEVCPVDRKCFFGIVLKVSFSASAPEARDKKADYF